MNLVKHFNLRTTGNHWLKWYESCETSQVEDNRKSLTEVIRLVKHLKFRTAGNHWLKWYESCETFQFEDNRKSLIEVIRVLWNISSWEQQNITDCEVLWILYITLIRVIYIHVEIYNWKMADVEHWLVWYVHFV